jgi:hypothetical protein
MWKIVCAQPVRKDLCILCNRSEKKKNLLINEYGHTNCKSFEETIVQIVDFWQLYSGCSDFV